MQAEMETSMTSKDAIRRGCGVSHLLAGRAVLCVAVVVIPKVLNASLWRQLRRDAIRPLHISAYTTSATAVSHMQQTLSLLLHHVEDLCELLPQN